MKTVQKSRWKMISMTTEVAAGAVEVLEPLKPTGKYQTRFLFSISPPYSSHLPLQLRRGYHHLTANRQITLAGTTQELRAYLLTLPGPLPAGQRAPSRTLGESRRQGVTAAALQRASGHQARRTPESGARAPLRLTGQKAEPATEVPTKQTSPATAERASERARNRAAPPSRKAGD